MTMQRYHALDNLRGILMWLGVVIHVALNHATDKTAAPWGDNLTSEGADLFVLFIHTFRMPAFFILAGFFVAMLIVKNGPQGMLSNRLKRLALPFVVFWPIFIVVILTLALMFISKIKLGYVSLDTSLIDKDPNHTSSSKMAHLWFLYYLILFCLLATVVHRIARYIPSDWKSFGKTLLLKLAKGWWGAIFLTLPLVFAGVFYKQGLFIPDGSFIPNPLELLHNGSYFAFGCFFFYQREILFEHYQRYCWRYFSASMLLIVVALVPATMSLQGKFAPGYDRIIPAFTYNILGWIGSFALIGMFMRYSSRHNKVLSYLADSSYWVYLVHLFGTVGFGILLYNAPLPLFAKILINISLTSAACLLSYHLLVRYTWIGKLLNGKRHQRVGNMEISTTKG